MSASYSSLLLSAPMRVRLSTLGSMMPPTPARCDIVSPSEHSPPGDRLCDPHCRGSLSRICFLFQQIEFGLPYPSDNLRLLELSLEGRGLDAQTGPLQGVPLEQDHHLPRVIGVSEDTHPAAAGVFASLGVEDFPPTRVISDLVPLEQIGHDRSPPSRRPQMRVDL